MSYYGQQSGVLVLKHHIMIMDHCVHVIGLDRLDLQPGMHGLDVFSLPEKLAFLLQERLSILYMSAMLSEAPDRCPTAHSAPYHPLGESEFLRQKIVFMIASRILSGSCLCIVLLCPLKETSSDDRLP